MSFIDWHSLQHYPEVDTKASDIYNYLRRALVNRRGKTGIFAYLILVSGHEDVTLPIYDVAAAHLQNKSMRADMNSVATTA